MFLTETGIAVPAGPQKAIHKAEDAAKTEAEREVVILLKDLLQAKLNTNMSRSMITMFGSPTCTHECMAREAEEAIAASEKVQQSCRIALTLVLHRRVYSVLPQECKSIAEEGLSSGRASLSSIEPQLRADCTHPGLRWQSDILKLHTSD